MIRSLVIVAAASITLAACGTTHTTTPDHVYTIAELGGCVARHGGNLQLPETITPGERIAADVFTPDAPFGVSVDVFPTAKMAENWERGLKPLAAGDSAWWVRRSGNVVASGDGSESDSQHVIVEECIVR